MSLLVQIKKDQIAARKEKEKLKASLLTTLIGEAEMVGKNDGNRDVTNSEVIAVVKKFIKNIDESLSHCNNDDLLIERNILADYLPKQFDDQELKSIIFSHITSMQYKSVKDMGDVMKWLKENYDGQYDGKTASQFVRELLI